VPTGVASNAPSPVASASTARASSTVAPGASQASYRSGGTITGIRSWIGRRSGDASIVRIVQVSRGSPSGGCQRSQSPAKANGARDIFVNTMFYQGLLGRYVTDWGGPESFPRKLGFDMRATNCPGDTLTLRGKVTKKYQQDGQKLVDLDVRVDNQSQQDTVTARITLELV